MSTPDRIVIAGAGPVGLVTALRLASSGIPSVVLEKASDVPRDLRATTFHPPTLDMLEDMGVLSAIEPLGIVTPAWQVFHLQTRQRAVFEMAAIGDLTRHPYRLQVEQFKLVKELFERARVNPLIDLRLDAEVSEIGQDATGAWAKVKGETLRGAYLVGADGSHSVVRPAVGLKLEGETYPSLTILVTTDFPFEQHIPELIGANYVWGPIDSFSMFRLREEWRCTFYPRPGQDEDIALTDEALQERLHGIVAIKGDFPIRERRGYRIHQRIVPRYNVGRIVLAGDAAHLNAPTGGMGMNGGVHDAVNLSDKLRRILAGEPATLLDDYSAERQPVAKEEIIAHAADRRRGAAEVPRRPAGHRRRPGAAAAVRDEGLDDRRPAPLAHDGLNAARARTPPA